MDVEYKFCQACFRSNPPRAEFVVGLFQVSGNQKQLLVRKPQTLIHLTHFLLNMDCFGVEVDFIGAVLFWASVNQHPYTHTHTHTHTHTFSHRHTHHTHTHIHIHTNSCPGTRHDDNGSIFDARAKQNTRRKYKSKHQQDKTKKTKGVKQQVVDDCILLLSDLDLPP